MKVSFPLDKASSFLNCRFYKKFKMFYSYFDSTSLNNRRVQNFSTTSTVFKHYNDNRFKILLCEKFGSI